MLIGWIYLKFNHFSLSSSLMSVHEFGENIGLTHYHKLKWSLLVTLNWSWLRSWCVSAMRNLYNFVRGEILFLGWIFADCSGQHLARVRPSSIQHQVRSKPAQLHDMTFHQRRTKPQSSTPFDFIKTWLTLKVDLAWIQGHGSTQLSAIPSISVGSFGHINPL